MQNDERIPLSWLIEQPTLLKPIWDQFSVPQQTLIKAAYGMPLRGEAERKAWAVFNGSCQYDELGYVTEWTEVAYEPREYGDIVGLIGRRAGKSFLTCFMTLYEILFGGHVGHVGDGQQMVVPYVCYDLPTARYNMRAIVQLAKKVKKLAAEIESEGRDQIQFRNGITVMPEPPTVKTGRGIAIPIVIMDEVGFWYKMSDNANPDYEVQRALIFSQSQFPHFKQFIISTPYTEEGLLYDYAKAGTGGRYVADPEERKQYEGALVVRSSTAAFENPRMHKLGRKQMERLYYSDDPLVFARESLAQFIQSESNFVNSKMVDLSTDKGVTVRRKAEIEKTGLQPSYVAAMDPAFRYDDFAFTICHRDGDGKVVQDLLRVWSPDPKNKLKLDPSFIMAQIKMHLQEYGIHFVYSDQYQLETLQQIALNMDFTVFGEDFTGRSKAVIYGSLEQMLRTGQIRLLDNTDQRKQLVQLEKKVTALNNVHIGAPKGKHDDIVSALAIAATKALQHMPTMQLKPKQESMFERLVRQNQAKLKGDQWVSA